MQRVSFYIDGFNVYHKINEYQEKIGICYKWLDYKSLLKSILNENQVLQDIYFFTAISKFKGTESVVRHNKYITALENTGITIITGKFIRTPLECRVKNCSYGGKKTFIKAEEKQSDVNLAINMVLDSRNNKYDKCFLISSDSDFVPALRKVRYLGKEAGLIIPPQDKMVKIIKTDALRYASQEVIELKFDELGKYILPKIVRSPINNIPVMMPKEYMTSEKIKEILGE